jgi:hypothetical protein
LRPTIDDGGKRQICAKSLSQTADNHKNRFVSIFIASPVGEQAGGEKLEGLLPLWPPLGKIFFQGADRIQLKLGVGTPEKNKKIWAPHRVSN